MNLRNLILGGIMFGLSAGNSYANPDKCNVSINYRDNLGRQVTLVDEGCDGTIDHGEIKGYNESRIVLAQDLEDPSKWIALNKQYGEVALGKKIEKAPYQKIFDNILKELKGTK